jgi:adenylosuccinate synthase
MPNIVIVGAQWGDEGKGKVVDVITPHFDVIVRYQGGNNAGHTVVVGREKFVLQTIPSGILHPGRRNIIGCGVVVNPGSLINEMESLVQRGVSLDGNLYISKNAHVIMPYHPALDRASESKAGKHRIGTTGRVKAGGLPTRPRAWASGDRLSTSTPARSSSNVSRRTGCSVRSTTPRASPSTGS